MSIALGHFDGGMAEQVSYMNQRDFSSDQSRCEGVAQIMDSEILDFGNVAGGAKAATDIFISRAVLSAKYPLGGRAVSVCKQFSCHQYVVRGVIDRDDAALAAFGVVAFEGESARLEIDPNSSRHFKLAFSAVAVSRI